MPGVTLRLHNFKSHVCEKPPLAGLIAMQKKIFSLHREAGSIHHTHASKASVRKCETIDCHAGVEGESQRGNSQPAELRRCPLFTVASVLLGNALERCPYYLRWTNRGIAPVVG